jgi:uroporphyrinogen-III synthase
MAKHKEEKYLVPLSSVHNDDVATMLDAKKLKHTECVMYRTVSNDFTDEEKKNFDYDMMLFFSPTGVKALKKNFPDFKQGDVKIGAFGPATAKTVAEEGLRLDLEAPTGEFPSMSSALEAYLKKKK